MSGPSSEPPERKNQAPSPPINMITTITPTMSKEESSSFFLGFLRRERGGEEPEEVELSSISSALSAQKNLLTPNIVAAPARSEAPAITYLLLARESDSAVVLFFVPK